MIAVVLLSVTRHWWHSQLCNLALTTSMVYRIITVSQNVGSYFHCFVHDLYQLCTKPEIEKTVMCCEPGGENKEKQLNEHRNIDSSRVVLTAAKFNVSLHLQRQNEALNTHSVKQKTPNWLVHICCKIHLWNNSPEESQLEFFLLSAVFQVYLPEWSLTLRTIKRDSGTSQTQTCRSQSLTLYDIFVWKCLTDWSSVNQVISQLTNPFSPPNAPGLMFCLSYWSFVRTLVLSVAWQRQGDDAAPGGGRCLQWESEGVVCNWVNRAWSLSETPMCLSRGGVSLLTVWSITLSGCRRPSESTFHSPPSTTLIFSCVLRRGNEALVTF